MREKRLLCLDLVRGSVFKLLKSFGLVVGVTFPQPAAFYVPIKYPC